MSREYHLSILNLLLGEECQDSEAAQIIIITGGPIPQRYGQQIAPPPLSSCLDRIYCQLKNGTFSFPPSFHFQPAYCTAIKALSQILLCCKIVGILAEYFST